MARVLIAEDDFDIREFLTETLEMAGHTVTAARHGKEAAEFLDKRTFDVLVTDLYMPHMTGMDLLKKINKEQPEIQVIMLTANASIESAVEAMRLGALEYLQKPISSPTELQIVVHRAAERRALLEFKEQVDRDREPSTDGRLSWGAPAMKPVVNALKRVAKAQATVLLQGESGTGKEVTAQAVHDWSPRADKPFVAVNCAALSETLIESELFGHEKGAFTGAHQQQRGRIELAHGGTFFLDEVGELKLDLQAKLLRVIETRQFERVGGRRTIEVDVRWVAATHRDLAQMVEDGTFREDLYHRLAVFPVQLPPLRDRREDIVPLAELLLQRIGKDLGRSKLHLSKDAKTLLTESEWPGNVRDLRNALERATILADGDELDTDAFMLLGGRRPKTRNTGSAGLAGRPLADIEKQAISETLQMVEGNRRKAAESLGIGLRTLYDKLKKYDLT